MSNTPTAAQVAKARRSGATWSEVREQFSVKWSSGKFTEALNAAGFDAAGLKLDGSGPSASKARVWTTPNPARRAVPAKQKAGAK